MADQPQSFPALLHTVLSDAASGSAPELEAIVSFQDHGRAFRIHNQELFCDTVLPLLSLEPMEWDDFLANLARFGFHRLTNAGPDQGAFYHELFLRSQPQLVVGIVRDDELQIDELDCPGPDFSTMPAMARVVRARDPPSIRLMTAESRMIAGPVVGAPTLPFGHATLYGLLRDIIPNNPRLVEDEEEEDIMEDVVPDVDGI
ncbi:transcription factor [Seminavis robusta]|uniref:Transcription factor n=1 Tax=Seminavis robusta TaxID=568900 RepID=A0A9N8ELG1_9STRA|nr:transcription factor [Seminavis robusta]|eukprot:Sro1279_g258840.1 transcription factor (202) ;mRNA; f:14761-15802